MKWHEYYQNSTGEKIKLEIDNDTLETIREALTNVVKMNMGGDIRVRALAPSAAKLLLKIGDGA